jgi:acetyl esterase/lipase
MCYKNYFDFPKNPEYEILYDSLIKIYNNILIKDGVCKDIKNWKDPDFDARYQKLHNDILNTKIMAKRGLEEIDKEFPCVFYHHGAQSTPFDNNVFCEYMASNGYVVVSSDYELPSKWGFLITATDGNFNPMTDITFVLKMTKSMRNVDSTKIVAAGHSWGAQMELMYDNKTAQKDFKKIMAFHTTFENQDLKKAKEYWPEFNYLFKNKCKLSTTPTVLFAPIYLRQQTKKDGITDINIIPKLDTIFPQFSPFRRNKTTPYTFVTVKKDITHDGFIALGNLSTPYAQKYDLADRDKRIIQQTCYEQILFLARQIATSSLNNSSIPLDSSINANFKFESSIITK